MHIFHRVFFYLFLSIVFQIPSFAQDAEVFVQTGNTSSISSVGLSPDGKLALSANYDGIIKLWETESGLEIRSLRGHQQLVFSAVFSDDGQYVLSGSSDQTLRLWDINTGQEKQRFTGHTGSVLAVLFASDQQHVISGSFDKTIRIWDINSHQEITQLKGHQAAITSLALTPDGKWLVSGSNDGTVKLWDLPTKKLLRNFKSDSLVKSVAISPDSNYILAGYNANMLKLWDTQSGEEVYTLEEQQPVNTVAFSADGRLALAGTDALRIWDVETGKDIFAHEPLVAPINQAVFSSNSQYVLAGGDDFSMRLWDLNKQSQAQIFEGNTDAVLSGIFLSDGQSFLSAHYDGTLKLWNAVTGSQSKTFIGHEGPVNAVVTTLDSKLAVSGGGDGTPSSQDNTLRLWELNSGRQLWSRKEHTASINSLDISVQGQYVLSASDDRSIKLWNLTSGKLIHSFSGHTGAVHSAQFSPDGKMIVSAGSDTYVFEGDDIKEIKDHSIKIWDVTHRKLLRSLTGHTSSVNAAIFTDEGRAVLSASYDNTLRLWDTATGKEIRRFKGDTQSIVSLSLSPNGQSVLAGHYNHHLSLWDLNTGQELKVFKGHQAAINTVAFSPNGKRGLSSSDDGELKLWELQSGQELSSLIGLYGQEWVSLTPQGYFNLSSPEAAKRINVRVGNKIYPINNFYEQYFRPEQVQLTLSGQVPNPASSLLEVALQKPAPEVSLLNSLPEETTEPLFRLQLKIKDQGGGVGNTKVYVNDVLVNGSRGAASLSHSQAIQQLPLQIPLIEGQNRVRLTVSNEAGTMESKSLEFNINARIKAANPRLLILAVGINEYRNQALKLRYAQADAESLVNTLQNTSSALFQDIQVTTLTSPEATTRIAIETAFEKVAQTARPEDVFVFYVASHGLIDKVQAQDTYFLLPSNTLFLSPEHLEQGALTQQQLAELIGRIPSQKKLVVLDTCHAGQAGQTIAQNLLTHRGISEATAVKLLRYATGSAIFSASASEQQALEGYQGHGLFTYVLMEGLQGKADLDHNQLVDISELKKYVEEKVFELAEQVFQRQQLPQVELSGNTFPISRNTK